MANGCKIAHPLKREGTFQFERFPLELEDAYLKIDERTPVDLIRQTKEFSELVRYYNDLNIVEGSWQEFFEEMTEDKLSSLSTLEKESNTSPHLALFLAFLKIFGIAQDNLNKVTKRHLDFYYKVILQMKSNPAKPDKVTIFFEAEKSKEQVKVDKGTLLSAGKDPSGKELLYKTTSELIVNHAEVSEVKTIFLQKAPDGSKVSLHASMDAFTENVIEDATATTVSLHAFGSSANMPASLGFAIASPVLNLREGKRRITLAVSGIEKLDRTGVQVDYTSEKGWIEAELVSKSNSGGSSFDPRFLFVKVTPGQPAFTPYDPKVHGGTMATIHPLLRFRVRMNSSSSLMFNKTYNLLKSVKASNIGITVQVSGIKNLILQSDSGPVDTTKPFQAFGAVPAKSRSKLYIGCYEAFNRYLQSFNLGFSWKGLPGNIRKHYSTYSDALELLYAGHQINQKKYFDTAQFDAFEPGHPPGKLSILDNGRWQELGINAKGGYPSKQYFDPYRTLHDVKGISKTHDFWQNVYKTDSLPEGELKSEYSYEQSKTFTNELKNGFARIELQYDFGHKAYPVLYTLVASYNAKHADQKRLPESPYTPEFDSLTLDYTASTIIDFSTSPENQFFHLLPFGHNEINDQHHPLIPEFEEEGQILIGLSNLKQPAVVSIYFQLENNTGNVDKSIDSSNRVNWYYLAHNHWVRFKQSDVLENTTNAFTNSGYMKFSIPRDAITPHDLLKDGLVWIRGTVSNESDAYPNLLNILTQAIEAVLSDNGNDVSHLEYALPAGSITKFKEKVSGIKKVSQNFDSFGGRLPEDDREFYTRASERLRHKNRVWSIWDYERMVLQQFPEIFKVKCIPHANADFEYAPGEVLLVLLPYITNVDYSNILEPRVTKNTLQLVADFIKTRSNPFLKVQVVNPAYEYLRISCSVKLKKEYSDITFYTSQLITDLKGYLAPWSIDTDAKPSFEGKIYKSHVINFIEEREYIDYITAFDVFKHLKDGSLINCDEEISGSAESVILTSYSTHTIIAS